MDCGHVTRDVGMWLDTLNVLVPSSIWNTTALNGQLCHISPYRQHSHSSERVTLSK
jgi:hypothetical protein